MCESDISAWAPFHGGQRKLSATLNEAAHDSSAAIIAAGAPGLKLEPRAGGAGGPAGPLQDPGCPRWCWVHCGGTASCREVPVAPGSALAHTACGQASGFSLATGVSSAFRQ